MTPHDAERCSPELRTLRRCSRALLSLASALLPLSATAGEISANPARDAWPTAVRAHYRLAFNGIDVGRLEMTSSTDGKTYALSGSGKVSVLFGLITWSGTSNVSGTVEDGAPVPRSYAFDWRNNKRGGKIQIGFKDRVATKVAVTPPPSPHRDLVPLTPAHKAGALDPVSAILMLTRADGRPPCDRRVSIFDGKQRYDIVFSFKRTVSLPSPKGGGPAETAYVCRAMYEPVAGHRDNDDTRTYASNRDVEVVLRRIPGSDVLIPYSVTVPTFWGTGSMVTERIDITTAKSERLALTR